MKHIENIKAEVKTKTNNSLIKGMDENTSFGVTENGALTYTQSGSRCVDFFAQAGAMRKNPDKAVELFKKAFAEDEQTAVRILFYLRDVRGGQGERSLFRNCLEWLVDEKHDIFAKVAEHIPEYGRWDDLLFDDDVAFDVIKTQFDKDVKSETPSLLSKWLPTANASSANTRAKAKVVADKLEMTLQDYRQTVRDIRKKIKTVEEQMSARKWGEIDYSKVPSQAARIYKNAFAKHDEERYNEFIGKAVTGDVKIKANTLYPYQIYKSVQNNYSKTLEALWNQLPDYTQGKNALVVADVSGSMYGDPMSVSVSLALYFAERNKGQFKDYFLTFSEKPRLQKVEGKTLKERMNNLEKAYWEMNTNLQAVFDLILNTAIENQTPQEEMPETIYIISDMEFDYCVEGTTNFTAARDKFTIAGYKVPNVVFWNVDARSGENLPVRQNETGVALVSGYSPSAFKLAVENKNPLQVMRETVNSERYARIVL
jgi:hypothetical protein